MHNLIINRDPRVAAKFEDYPGEIRPKMQHLRELIIEVARDDRNISMMEETLKWGEPSYLVKMGSTIRIDWKPKTPDQYAMYFKCTSKLVPSFKAKFGDLFKYENTRAILFGLKDKVPERELKECIRMALKYHTLKHLPGLGG